MEKQMRVWWIPQVPMKGFIYPVQNIETAIVLLDALAEYDNFQYENNIKPDYCNAGGLEVFEDGEWHDWYDEETGESIEDIMEKQLSSPQPTVESPPN